MAAVMVPAGQVDVVEWARALGARSGDEVWEHVIRSSADGARVLEALGEVLRRVAGLPVWHDGAYRDPLTDASLPSWEEALDDLDAQLAAGPAQPASHVVRFGAQTDVKGIIAPSPDADRTIRYLTKYLTKSLADTYAPADHDHADARVGDPDEDAASVRATVVRARYGAHVDRLHEEVRWLPCSPECANWLRHGVQPKDCVPGMEPGRCGKRAHERDNLGYGGRRVQISHKWSGKTLAQHKADRATVVRETLAAAGIEAPDIDRMGVDQVLDDGLPRFVWDDVPMPEADYAAAILASVRERNHRREQYEHAKQQLDTGPRTARGHRVGLWRTREANRLAVRLDGMEVPGSWGRDLTRKLSWVADPGLSPGR